MILPLRVALAVLAVIFTYFFGETLEKFLLEVIRFFVAMESSNALMFNGVHMLISICPLILMGLIVSISFSGEELLRNRLWSVVLGVILGLASYRGYQLWWLFGGGIGGELDSSGTSYSIGHFYFLEKVLPYLIMGIAASAIISFFEKETLNAYIFSLVSTSSAFIWLLATHKIQNVEGFVQTGSALLFCLVSGTAVTVFINFIKPARELKG